MIEGNVEVVDERTIVKKHQPAWLDKLAEKGNSHIKFTGGQNTGRVICMQVNYRNLPL